MARGEGGRRCAWREAVVREVAQWLGRQTSAPLRPVRLTFYNLTNNQPVSTARTASDLKKALADIREVGDEIRTSLFQPAPGFACKWCDYVPVCPAHEEIY